MAAGAGRAEPSGAHECSPDRNRGYPSLGPWRCRYPGLTGRLPCGSVAISSGARLGAVTLSGDRLLFLPLPDDAGIYRFRFAGRGITGSYIGEASQLRRRAYHYAHPGPSQMTNIRMHAEVREHLTAGGRIEVSLITAATIGINGVAAVLDLVATTSRSPRSWATAPMA